MPLAITGPDRGSSCIDCSTDSGKLEWLESWGIYKGSLERVIHAFKFERHDFLGEPLGVLLAEPLRERGDLDFDVIVPVPMHRGKERDRGYNQAELLARSLGSRTGIEVRRGALRKTRPSQTQSQLPRAERAANVRGSFAAGEEVSGLHILLVDDICTTGETVEACAKALRKAGAVKVCAAVIARA